MYRLLRQSQPTNYEIITDLMGLGEDLRGLNTKQKKFHSNILFRFVECCLKIHSKLIPRTILYMKSVINISWILCILIDL